MWILYMVGALLCFGCGCTPTDFQKITHLVAPSEKGKYVPRIHKKNYIITTTKQQRVQQNWGIFWWNIL